MLTIQHTEEDLSRAYVQAIAAKAGVNLSMKDRSHDYTIDGTFHQVSYFNSHYHETGFSLDFQLKASKNCIIDDTHLRYDLDVETHNYLVDRAPRAATTPVILILMVLPEAESEWLSLSEEELVLRRCCYWIYLSGERSKNARTQRIEISRQNFLTPNILNEVLTALEKGKLPS